MEFKSGAVVVDMNADVGGNCELTKPGEITTEHGVTIIGIESLQTTLSNTASMLFSNNMTNFMTSLVDKEGNFTISDDDDILEGAPEGSDFYVNGMGGLLICSGNQIHSKQTRLAEVMK